MSASNPVISILVPCYNVEKYLLQCLESIQSQSISNFEVICINDGSTDGTEEILNQIARIDPRFIVIDKPNSGYGDSMNQGLLKAQGEYIGIVESDDFIDQEMFKKLYKEAKEKSLQISRCAYFQYDKGTLTPVTSDWVPKNKVFNPNVDNSPFWQAPAIWSAIYKRDWLLENNIRFLPTPGASYQDTSFAFKCYACCERFHMIEEPLLFYRMDNEQSSINQPDKVFCVCDEWSEIYSFIKKDKTRFRHLLPLMPVIQFGTYKWNYERIASVEMKRLFLKCWIKECLLHLLRGDYPPSVLRKDTLQKAISFINKQILNTSRFLNDIGYRAFL